MIVIDPKLLEQLEGSTCFGIAYDEKAKECKMCDLVQECSAKTASNSVYDQIKVLNPETQKAMDEVKAKRKEREKLVNEDGLTPRQLRKKRKREERERLGMPETKGMSIDELWKLLEERGGTCKVYDNPNVQKIRLAVELKKTYVAEYERKHGKLEK